MEKESVDEEESREEWVSFALRFDWNCSSELVVFEGCFAGTAMESDIDARRSESGSGED
ncbi:hypothetical protein MKW92_046221 [Papaver armeniacum]|nr:hypothetical protein MKW92_046221 [Papaver armeniacum]